MSEGQQEFFTYSYLDDGREHRVPARRRSAAPRAQLWRCMCEGCGAPLQVDEIQCSYCLRATGVVPSGDGSGVKVNLRFGFACVRPDYRIYAAEDFECTQQTPSPAR